MIHKAIGAVCAAATLCASTTAWASLGVIFAEDFESYNNTTEMEAVWTGFDAMWMTEIDDNLDGTPEETGKFAFHPGGSVNIHNLAAPVSATATEWLRLSVDIYDNDTSLDPDFPLNPHNKRVTLGMRNHTDIANILEIGTWNTPNHFQYRAVIFESINGTPNPNWQAWDLGNEIVDGTLVPVNRFLGAGWIRYHVTIKPQSLLFELDLGADGTIDGSMEHFDIGHTMYGFDQLRFGGASGVSSAGGGVTFDNIVLEAIASPQPATLGLLIAGLPALCRRRSQDR